MAHLLRKGQQGLVIAVIAVISIVLCAVLSSYTHRSPAHSSALERFYAAPQVPANWKGPKTPLLAINGVHWFFSDGVFKDDSTNVTNHVFFTPSEKDTLCFYTKQDTNMPDAIRSRSVDIDCRELHPKEYSLPDQRPIPNDMTCDNGDINLPPLDQNDAQVRVLSSMYQFNKRCLRMKNISLTQSGANLIMQLDPDSLDTKVFVLLRPVFISTLNSMLYEVSYDVTRDYYYLDNSIINYDSTAATPVRVVLKPVRPLMFEGKQHYLARKTRTMPDDAFSTYAAIQEKTNGITNTMVKAAMQGTVTVDYLAMTMYYMTPTESLIETQRKAAQSMVCVFRNPTQGAKPSAGSQLFGNELNITINGDRTSREDLNQIDVSRGTMVKSMNRVPLDATTIVTFSHNLVVVASISPTSGAVRVMRMPAFGAMYVPDAYNSALHQALNNIKDSAAIQYDVFCIPNLLHMALDMNTRF
jgi:hypothetical protein